MDEPLDHEEKLNTEIHPTKSPVSDNLFNYSNEKSPSQDSSKFLAQIVESIADPVFVKDRNHRWVFLNDALCDFLGYPREELVDKSDYDFFPKEEADVFWKRDEIVFETGQEDINEEQLTDVDGVTHTIQTKKRLYEDQNGEKWIVGIFRDMTEFKRAEQKLQEKNIALKEILEQIEVEKKLVQKQIYANIDHLVVPILRNLKQVVKAGDLKYIHLLEQNLELITNSFGQKISRKYFKLTPMEMEVCNLIKNGFKTKDIAQFLHISPLTVETHRNRIRKKLGINNKSVNLVSFLQNL